MILEPAFLLCYYGGITPAESYDYPLAYKRWFIQRISKEMTKGSENGEEVTQSRAAHHNTPDARYLQGMDRQQVPARLRRFK